jgi:hypothetical protein
MRLPGGKELLFAAADATFQWWQAYCAVLDGKPRKATKELAEIGEQKQIPWVDSQQLASERVTVGLRQSCNHPDPPPSPFPMAAAAS